MSYRCIHFSWRLAALAVALAPLFALGGCRTWNFHKDFWSVERYRDHRAADIDERLSKEVPIGKNPF